eukprot:Phypoly_transcript_08803.p1 GENE.Phypoly_transcript_08803~~Phypoly_transcript_08803.p1  ORF type:complete len:481 (+),score=70.13 Phypoly_transcript_08803:161-1444(+)
MANKKISFADSGDNDIAGPSDKEPENKEDSHDPDPNHEIVPQETIFIQPEEGDIEMQRMSDKTALIELDTNQKGDSENSGSSENGNSETSSSSTGNQHDLTGDSSVKTGLDLTSNDRIESVPKLELPKQSVVINMEATSTTKDENKNAKPTGARTSRLNSKSVKTTVASLHFSYIFAMFLIAVFFAVSFAILKHESDNMSDIIYLVELSETRTQYFLLTIADLTIITSYGADSPAVKRAASGLPQHVNLMMQAHNKLPDVSYNNELLYTDDCVRVYESDCSAPGSAYHSITSQGIDYMLHRYYFMIQEMLQEITETGTLAQNNTNYIIVRAIGGKDYLEGLQALSFNYYLDAARQTSTARKEMAVVTVVECVLFILIYRFFFKRFITSLNAENEYTFSIIRMIPRHLVSDIPEIDEFLREISHSDKD